MTNENEDMNKCQESQENCQEQCPPQQAPGCLQSLYRDWFLDYASYVILDRAIPALEDGLKPVQRRILHAISELEDGRYNKAANVIGHTMRYHPHGDMAISDAMIRLAQKDLLIDTQGNWGNPLTGDRAAAPRYIEGRLTEFAREVVYNPETTRWQPSYDGRNKEPVMLPVKFPLLLAQGVEGIAVGLSTRILPHNFCELLRESIAILKGFKPQLFPDFQSGGMADFSDYKDGKKGGKVRIRASIEIAGPKLLIIREIPYGTTTQGLIDSILSANDKGQIKIKKVVDNTSDNIEILVQIPASTKAEKIKEALYAFTDCEVSISPNCCVIRDGSPDFCSVSRLLDHSTRRTKDLLYKELKIRRGKTKEKLFTGILEQFFIEEKIYRKIEKCTDWDAVIGILTRSVQPITNKLHRPITKDDLEKLTEIRIKRISKFDQNQSLHIIQSLKKDLVKINNQIKDINNYCIEFFEYLLKKYGHNRERRTKITSFSKVNVSRLISADQKVYINRKEGFIGTSLKKEDFLFECTRLDEIIAFCQDGSFQVSKISDKTFYGKNIMYAAIFKKGDEKRIWNALYRDEKSSPVLAKRFTVLSASRDKQYFISKDPGNCRLIYLSESGPEESDEVSISLRKKGRLKKSDFVLNFGTLAVKNRIARGTVITKETVSSVTLLGKTPIKPSTLNQRLWYDRNNRILNIENQGHYLGKFTSDGDRIVILRLNGTYTIAKPSLKMSFHEDVIQVEKLTEHMVISTICSSSSTRATAYVVRTYLSNIKDGQHSYIGKGHSSGIKLATLTNMSDEEIARRANAPGITQEKIPLEEFFDAKTLKEIEKKFSPDKG